MHRICRCENIECFQNRTGNHLGKDRFFAVWLCAHVPQNMLHPFENQTWRVLGGLVKASTTAPLNHIPLSDNIMKLSYEGVGLDRTGPLVYLILADKSHSFHCRRSLTWSFWDGFLRGGWRGAFDHETVIYEVWAGTDSGEIETCNLGSASGTCTDCALKIVLDLKGSSNL